MQYRDYLQIQGIDIKHVIYLHFESFEYQWVKNADDFQQLMTQLLPKSQEKILFAD